MSEKYFFEPKKNELDSKNNNTEKLINNKVEKNERPKYRYFYHGTFAPLADNIKKDGFNSKEYYPNLTLSPLEGFRFLDRIMKKGGRSLETRFRYLSPEDQAKIKLENLSKNDCVLLVIEPPEEYKAHSTSEGSPNLFSSLDQIPDDINKTIRTRAIWNYHQHAMAKEPIKSKDTAEIKYPGLNLDYKMLPDGKWVKLEKKNQIITPFKLPSSAIKMVIESSPEFLEIFQDMEKDIENRKEIDLVSYIKKVNEYLKNAQKISGENLIDKNELAENMVMGQLEYYIVLSIRNLYLDLQKYKGKKLVDWKTNKEEDRPIKTREQLLDKIEKLRSIDPKNNFLKRYINIQTRKIEKELM